MIALARGGYARYRARGTAKYYAEFIAVLLRVA